VIGDSVVLGAAPQVARAGFEVDARGCRTIEQGLALLRERRRADRLPGLVVLALGTNASISRDHIRRALALLGPERVLALVTPRDRTGGSGAAARAVRAAGRRWPNRVRVLDWVAASGRHRDWRGGDGIHLTAAGADGLARLLRRVRDVRVTGGWSGAGAVATG
jgi:hypothetical protein